MSSRGAEVFDQLDAWGAEGRPCLFLTEATGRSGAAWPLDRLPPGLRFAFEGAAGGGGPSVVPAGETPARPKAPGGAAAELNWQVTPPDRAAYQAAFDRVHAAQRAGDCWLANLTAASQVTCTWSPEALFEAGQARAKLLWSGQFLFFSPEVFVTIEGGAGHPSPGPGAPGAPAVIATRPMKGTCRDTGPASLKALLDDPKERAEHITAVDLLRNDLGRVGRNVRVPRFRYAERLHTHRGPMWTTSTLIEADLEPGWPRRLGSLLRELLPAGSVTGAPKRRTVEILAEAEGRPRGWYTGVAGVFDGRSLKSYVMIRFLDLSVSPWEFRSGGGVTLYSRAEDEYAELVEKVYVPLV